MSDPQSPFGKFLAFCALATSGSFGLSALVNGFLFWRAWKISYFRIADPIDVVMGGFALLVQFTWIFLAVTLFMRLSKWLVEKGMHRLGIRDQRNLSFEERIVEAAQENRQDFWMAVFFSAIFALPIALWGANVWDKSTWSLLTRPVEQPAIYQTGLRVSQDSTLPAGCLKADVLWLGTKSAILKCTQGLRILHNLDALVTEPKTQTDAE